MAELEASAADGGSSGCKKAGKWVKEKIRHDINLKEQSRPECIGYVVRLVQAVILILLLVVVFGIFYIVIQKKHLAEHTGLPGTTTNVWGVATSTSKVYDAQDLVIPAEENSAFFVTTNPIVTNEQERGECGEDASVENATCAGDSDCQYGHIALGGHGVRTGRCNKTTSTCTIEAWCPLEEDLTEVLEESQLDGISKFRVFIKNYAYFPHFEKSASNAKKTTDITGCEYDKETRPLCPVFTLGYIIDRALQGTDPQQQKNQSSSYENLIREGGVIGIKILWKCDFNKANAPEDCLPSYHFCRLDTGERNNTQGYYVKHKNVYFDSRGREKRQLITAHGILFVIEVEANGYKTDWLKIVTTLGSALGLFGGSSTFAICVLEACHKKKDQDQEQQECEKEPVNVALLPSKIAKA